jgi:hypothetical protein
VAHVEQIVTPDPVRLLEHAAAGFLVRRHGTSDASFPSPPYLLALRQGGVRDDLLALAAARGIPGWFDPPLCVFAELPEWLGRTAREPCGEFERVVLVGAVLKRAARAVFGRLKHGDEFVDAVDRWFGELSAEGVTPDAYDAALGRLGARDDFDRGRDADLAAAYRLYHAELSAGGRDERAARRDGRDTLVDCAVAVAEDPQGLARLLGGRREIRLLGLADLRNGWRVLLRALAASPVLDRIAIYAAQPLDLEDALHAAVTSLPAGDAGQPVRAGLISAADSAREADEVARRVRALAARGVPLPRIAVVARQARPYQDLMIRALERVGVPATARRRVAYREIPILRSLFALLDAAAERWSRHGLVELAEQPYLANELDSALLNYAGYRARITGLAAWGTALADLEREARRREEAVEDEDERRRPMPSRARIERARRRFAAFAALAEGLEGERPLTAWLEWLRDFLDRDPWKLRDAIYDVPGHRYEVARIDLRGLRDLDASVREWLEAVRRWGGGEEPLAVGAFRARLAEVLSGDAVLWTATQRGVRVLEAHAAAYRSFDHVFLVGLSADRFPVRPPASPILDAPDREALIAAGLPLETHAAWNARERELFRVLVAASREPVTVSYPRLDASGWEAVRSALVDTLAAQLPLDEEHAPADRVVTAGVPLFAVPELRGEAERVARMELARRAGVPSPYNGRIEDPALRAWLLVEFGDARVWSPTQLEAYAKCPWAYFSGRLLRIEKREEPDEELDPVTKGVVLHDALARFFARAAERVGGPVLLRPPDLAWARPLALAALDDAVSAAGAETWLGHPALRDAKRDELRRTVESYLAFEADYNEKMFNNRSPNAHLLRTGAAAHELSFEDAVLERGGVRIRFRGTMDRVDVAVDDRINDNRFVAAVDYKSSLAAVPGGGADEAWDDGVALQVPLYAHALAALRAGARVARVQYRTLRPPQVAHSLELYKVDRKTKVLHEDAAGRARLESALDAAVMHVRAARDGTFPAAPKASCGCPPFCHAWDICRVKGGPRVKWEP